MADETLSVLLNFESKGALAQLGVAQSAFKAFGPSFGNIQKGVGQLNKGFESIKFGAIGAGAGAAYVVKKYADFAGQMGSVYAVLGKGSSSFFPQLEEQALKLGASTVFTAKQAGEAMENLSRSGFSAVETMAAVPAVLDAAAAEGMDLGTAADIVASNIRSFSLSAKDAGMVADTLAYVSAKTASSIVDLQEGLKYVAPVADQLGISLGDTASAIGALSDIGVKGTLAGTALKNALLKISAGAKNGKLSIGGYTAQVVQSANGNVDLLGTLQNVNATLAKTKDPLKRATLLLKVFGLRGMPTATAAAKLTDDKLGDLFQNLGGKAAGSATEMARARLDNLSGDFVALSSAIDGATIRIGKGFSPLVRQIVASSGGLTDKLSSFGKAISGVFGADGEAGRAMIQQKLISDGLDASVVNLAKGFVDGFESAKNVFGVFLGMFKGLSSAVYGVFNPFGLMGGQGAGVEGATKLAFQLISVGTALKVTTSVFKTFGNVAVGTFNVLRGVLGTLKTGMQGTVDVLVKRFPTLAKVLPKGLGKLTGAIGAIDKATAQPVRVVNFDEAGGLTGGALAPGAPNPLAPQAPAAQKWGEKSKLGKVATVAGGLFQGAAAFGIGWEIGRALDEASGLSDFIGNLAGRSKGEQELINRNYNTKEMASRAGEQARMYAGLSGKLVTSAESPSKQIAVTQEYARARIERQLDAANIVGEERAAILSQIQPILARIAKHDALLAEGKPVEVTVKIDSREIARATAKGNEEVKNRSGFRKGESAPVERTAGSRRAVRR